MTSQVQHPPQRAAIDVKIPEIEKYSYCLGLHVKPTTIFIAVFKLINALLFASILLNSEFTLNGKASVKGFALEERQQSATLAVIILARIIMASVSALGIYAVISGRAALLMPLHAILLVDLFFALPAFCSRDHNLANNIGDYRNLPHDSDQSTRNSIMLFWTLSMIVKIYFLYVIWKCYRYLRLIELVSPIRLAEFYPHVHHNGYQYSVARVSGSADPTTPGTCLNICPPLYELIRSNTKPPNYEEATQSMSPGEVNSPNVFIQQQQLTVVTVDPTDGGTGLQSTIANQVNSSSSPVTGNAVA